MHASENSSVGAGRYEALFCREYERPADVRLAKSFRRIELVEGLGWDLPVVGELEQDEFDTDDAIHCLIRADGDLVGYFRAIRADLPYLAASKFPDLASWKAYPRHPLAWEVSRIAVRSRERRFEAALHLYSTMLWFARNLGAVSLCGFVDLNHERLFARAGLLTERYGEPATIGTDRFGRPITVVAGEIPVLQQSGVRFERLASLADQMEIEDAASLFGRSRVSA